MNRAAISVAVIALLTLTWEMLYLASVQSAHWLTVAYSISLFSLFFALITGGPQCYKFWVTLIAVYPLLTPFIVRDLLPFQYYSARAKYLQEPSVEIIPFMLAAISCLFFSTTIKVSKIPKRIIRLSSARIDRSVSNDRLFWLIFASVGMLFFAWLTEPGGIVGAESYSDIINQRIEGVNFAGGAWAAFSVLALAFFLRLEGLGSITTQRISKFVFGGSIFFSLTYLLLHARRSEVSGFLVLLLFIFGGRVSAAKKIMLATFAVLSLIVVGAIRDLTDPFSLLTNDYYQLPGGPGNAMIGYVATYNLVYAKGQQAFLLGQTYLGHLLRLPPAFLGLSRTPVAYDYINSIVPLTGGEFYLVEPLLNFGIFGVIVFLILFSFAINAATKTVKEFILKKNNLLSFMIAGMFLTLLFRSMWYGINPLTKGICIAYLLAISVILTRNGIKKHNIHRNISYE